MKKTIETITQDGGVWMDKNQNYIIKFAGDSDDKTNPERSIYVHDTTKGDMPWKVGMEVEYEQAMKKDGSAWSAGTANKKFTFPVVREIKPKQNKSFGGGGRAPKTYQEYVNELAWQTQQQTILFMCHRVNIDPTKEENGVSAFEKYYNLFYQTALKRLQP